MNNRKTIRLKAERLIGTHHLPEGAIVTLGDKEADALIRLGQAAQVAFDGDAVPPPPAKRPMIEAAAIAPGPRKAARLAGRAE